MHSLVSWQEGKEPNLIDIRVECCVFHGKDIYSRKLQPASADI
jgi:hypothetical protein